MSTDSKKKPKKQSAAKRSGPVTREELLSLYTYSVAPGYTQMKLAARSLVCASFLGVSVGELATVVVDMDSDWLMLADRQLLPLSEPGVVSMMSELESSEQIEWSESDLSEIPKKTLAALALDHPVKQYLIESISLLNNGKVESLGRARFNLKRAVGIDTDEPRFIEAYKRRIANSAIDSPVTIDRLIRHTNGAEVQGGRVAQAISSFAL